jgi:hypothetical protein
MNTLGHSLGSSIAKSNQVLFHLPEGRFTRLTLHWSRIAWPQHLMGVNEFVLWMDCNQFFLVKHPSCDRVAPELWQSCLVGNLLHSAPV